MQSIYWTIVKEEELTCDFTVCDCLRGASIMTMITGISGFFKIWRIIEKYPASLWSETALEFAGFWNFQVKVLTNKRSWVTWRPSLMCFRNTVQDSEESKAMGPSIRGAAFGDLPRLAPWLGNLVQISTKASYCLTSSVIYDFQLLHQHKNG